MLNKIVMSLMGLGLLGISSMAYAEADQRDELIARLSKQTEMLSKELKQLQQEVGHLKKPQHKNVSMKTQAHSRRHHRAMEMDHGPEPMPMLKIKSIHDDGTVPHWLYGGPVITTAPYFGVRSQFDASDLLVLTPSIHEDLRLLEFRQAMRKAKTEKHIPLNTHESMIKVSGKAEVQASTQRRFNAQKNSDLDLSDAELDFLITPSHNVTGFLAFNYDSGTSTAYPTRTGNSRLFLNKGFMTFGDLSYSPVYVTMGQFFVPFGRYASAMISSPLTTAMGRVKARAIQLGFIAPAYSGLSAETFVFRGNTLVNTTNTAVREGGLNLEYTCPNNKHRFGVSWLSNMGEVGGFQQTGGTFAGFATNTALAKRVPAYDLHGTMHFGSYSLNGEFVTAMDRFNAANLTFNGVGAKPSALNLEAGYNFTAFDKPTSLTFGYGKTREALGLNLPKTRYIAALNTSWFKDTIESIEFAHEINYGASDTASGAGGVAFGPTGQSQNRVVAQVGMYF